MKLNKSLYEIEKNWLKKLFNASADCFTGVTLPSHDQWHHYRVWLYAKELVKALSKEYEFSYNQLTNLQIACFFHDTGMSVTRDEKHGKEGAILCKQFFSNTTIQEPKNLNTALQAIEHHDDKSYKQGKTDTSSLTTILAIADDLDAFGYTGILRYAEIYILREVLLEELGERVTKNAENRFKNFKNNFKNHKSLINRHYNRLKILLDFYNNLPNKAYNKKIIELVRKNMLQNKPKSLIDLVENKEQDTKIQEFKNKLVGELNYFIRKSNSGLSSR